MSSPLSLFATSSLVLDFYSQFHNNSDLLSLLNHLQNDQNSSPKTKMNEFFTKLLHQTFDKYMQDVLNNDNYASIFKKDNLPEDEKVKLFIGYSIKEIYPKCREDLNNNYNIRTTDDIEIMVALSIGKLFDLVDCQNTKTGKDIYIQVIDHFSKQLTESFYTTFSSLIKRGDDNVDIHAKFMEATKKMLHSTNNTFNYNSPIRHKKRNRDDSSKDGDNKDDPNKRPRN